MSKKINFGVTFSDDLASFFENQAVEFGGNSSYIVWLVSKHSENLNNNDGFFEPKLEPAKEIEHVKESGIIDFDRLPPNLVTTEILETKLESLKKPESKNGGDFVETETFDNALNTVLSKITNLMLRIDSIEKHTNIGKLSTMSDIDKRIMGYE